MSISLSDRSSPLGARGSELAAHGALMFRRPRDRPADSSFSDPEREPRPATTGVRTHDGHGRRRKCRSVPSLARPRLWNTVFGCLRSPFIFWIRIYPSAFVLGNMKHAASLLVWCNYVQKRSSRSKKQDIRILKKMNGTGANPAVRPKGHSVKLPSGLWLGTV